MLRKKYSYSQVDELTEADKKKLAYEERVFGKENRKKNAAFLSTRRTSDAARVLLVLVLLVSLAVFLIVPSLWYEMVNLEIWVSTPTRAFPLTIAAIFIFLTAVCLFIPSPPKPKDIDEWPPELPLFFCGCLLLITGFTQQALPLAVVLPALIIGLGFSSIRNGQAIFLGLPVAITSLVFLAGFLA